MKTFFKQHILGIVISALIGALIAAPPLVFRLSPDFSGVDMLKTNTETHYVSQIQEVYDGRPELGNPFLGGALKEDPYLFPPIGPRLVAYTGIVLHLGAIPMVLASRFLFTSLMAFAIYYLCFLLTGRKLVGLVAAPFVLLAYSLVDPGHILELFNLRPWSQELTFIDYGRPTNPSLSSLFLFGYLVFFWQYLREGSKKYLGIISAVIFGLSFYVYLYTWTFIVVFTGFLFLIHLFWKEDKIKVKKILMVFGGAALLGIPYFIHGYEVTLHPLYEEASVRFGFFKSRHLELSRLTIASAILFAAAWKFFVPRLPLVTSSAEVTSGVFTEGTKVFFLAFFLSALVIVNEQVITGLYIFNHHWHWYYNTPLVIIFLTAFLFWALERMHAKKWVSISVASVLIMIFFYNGITSQRISYAHHLPEVVKEQQYAPLFEWINEATSKDDVILTSKELSSLIPAYTHGNVYYHGTGIYTLVSDAQLLHAYLVYTYLAGIEKAKIRDYLPANRDDISHFAYGYRYRLKKGVCLGCFPDAVIEEMSAIYEKLDDRNIISFIKEYPADYVIWDKLHTPNWKIGKLGLSVVKETPAYTVYALLR